jgi:hypothetical protein
MLNGSFIVHSFRRSPFTIMEANDAKSPVCTAKYQSIEFNINAQKLSE